MSTKQTIHPPAESSGASGAATSSRNDVWHIAGKLLASWTVRVIGTLLCLWLIANHVDLRQALQLLQTARWDLIFSGWFVTALLMVCAVGEWGVLVRSIKPVKWSFLGMVFIRMFAPGVLLPVGLGGEAVRVYKLAPEIGVESATATALVARASSSLALALWAFIGSLQMEGKLAGISILSSMVYLLATFAIWSLAFAPDKNLLTLLNFLSGSNNRFAKKLVPFVSAFRDLGTNRRAVLLSLTCSFVGWGLNFFALHLFALATGATPAWYLFAVVLPLSLVATIAPFLVSGIGLREGILIAAFVQSGVSAEQAGIIALLVDLQLVPFVLLSSFVWMLPESKIKPVELTIAKEK